MAGGMRGEPISRGKHTVLVEKSEMLGLRKSISRGKHTVLVEKSEMLGLRKSISKRGFRKFNVSAGIVRHSCVWAE